MRRYQANASVAMTVASTCADTVNEEDIRAQILEMLHRQLGPSFVTEDDGDTQQWVATVHVKFPDDSHDLPAHIDEHGAAGPPQH